MKDIVRSINILINVDKNYIPKVEYVFRTFCKILGLQPQFFYGISYDDVHVYYGEPQEEKYPIEIHYSGEAASFFTKKDVYPYGEVLFNDYKNEKIPFLFSKYGNIFAVVGKKRLKIQKDIISSAFYFLSCWQEYSLNRPLTPDNVYDFSKSLQFYWDFLEIPVVDLYANIFQHSLEQVLPGYQKIKKWPMDKTFALSVSHHIDVEEVFSNFHDNDRNGYRVVKDFKKKAMVNNIFKKILYTIKRESKYNFGSTFFVSGCDKELTEKHDFLKISLNKLRRMILYNEIALLGSFTSSYYQEILDEEYNNIDDLAIDCEGFRSETLSLHYQFCFSILEKISIKYDSSLGFPCPGVSGFRAGISYPFNPFNIVDNRPFNILEIPLSIILAKNELNQNMIPSESILKNKMNMIFKDAVNGKSHISLLAGYDWVGGGRQNKMWKKLYWESLKQARKYHGWICSLKDVYRYWEKR